MSYFDSDAKVVRWKFVWRRWCGRIFRRKWFRNTLSSNMSYRNNYFFW